MASRAQVADSYSFGNEQLYSHRAELDPVTIPRTSAWRTGSGALLAAVLFGGIISALTYAAYHPEPAAVTETPMLPLTSDWQPDTSTTDQARVTNLLQGPALAVPDRATFRSDEPLLVDTPRQSSTEHEVIIDDSAPGVQESLPGIAAPTWPGSSASRSAPPVPYPNPTTTPPDAIAPPETPPQTPTPVLDPENPYN